MKAFIRSQFGYFFLVLYKRALVIVYNIYKLYFENVLELDNYVSLHHRNIIINSIISNQVISEIFNLMFTKSHFELGPTYTTTYGLWTFRHFADKIWNYLAIDIRTSNTFSALLLKQRVCRMSV